MNLVYATSNNVKFDTANLVCKKIGLELERHTIDIPEIQAPDGESVARDKAQKVFDQLRQPVVISDDSWLIAGLNDFPGPFMKYVGKWLSLDDWMRLTFPLADRRVTLRQVIVYQDEHQQKLFYTDVVGTILHSPKGYQAEYEWASIMSLQADDTSIAQAITQTGAVISSSDVSTSWHDLRRWLKSRGLERPEYPLQN